MPMGEIVIRRPIIGRHDLKQKRTAINTGKRSIGTFDSSGMIHAGLPVVIRVALNPYDKTRICTTNPPVFQTFAGLLHTANSQPDFDRQFRFAGLAKDGGQLENSTSLTTGIAVRIGGISSTPSLTSPGVVICPGDIVVLEYPAIDDAKRKNPAEDKPYIKLSNDILPTYNVLNPAFMARPFNDIIPKLCNGPNKDLHYLQRTSASSDNRPTSHPEEAALGLVQFMKCVAFETVALLERANVISFHAQAIDNIRDPSIKKQSNSKDELNKLFEALQLKEDSGENSKLPSMLLKYVARGKLNTLSSRYTELDVQQHTTLERGIDNVSEGYMSMMYHIMHNLVGIATSDSTKANIDIKLL